MTRDRHYFCFNERGSGGYAGFFRNLPLMTHGLNRNYADISHNSRKGY